MARDPGLAAERTALAWRRTAVSAMVCAALFLNHAVGSSWRPAQLAPLGAAVTMGALAVLCYVRNRTLQEGRHGNGRAAVAVTALAVVTVAGVAFALGLTMPRP
ncbi:DUF202 domain-containing protein [Nocardia goodfellowii]|uniref:Uncharacterized membrane protein YidH (DUF202 family) n=1 Tax=Nocardia goodfellowii TaxID=882446 RepID=A0ABS4QEI6_9NOCA|nr:DUF202 domain-containing protein [Nocardia goodfellowii]MBP2190097.1 uncharacterized membrane protein YidH (DUF202 family) [Nocardia goodfellowii]